MVHQILVIGTPTECPAWLPVELARAGHGVTVASSVQEALARARVLLPSVVMVTGRLDVEATQLSLALLRTHPATSALPLVALTKPVAHDVVAAALAGGVVEVMTLPLTASDVLERLRFAVGDGPHSAAALHAVEWRGPVVLRRLGDHLSRMRCSGLLHIRRPNDYVDILFADGEVGRVARDPEALDRMLLAEDVEPWEFEFEPDEDGAGERTPPPARASHDRFLPDEDLAAQAESVGALRAATAADLARLPPVRVLVVDDDAAIRELYAAMVRRAGMLAFTANDGEDAYATVTRTRPDVVLTDIMMPNSDGWALLRLIREDARLRETRVLLTSCYDDYLSNLRSLEAGADDYLEKGLRAEALLDRVRHCISARRALLSVLDGALAFGGRVGPVGIQHLLLGLERVAASGVLTVKDGWTAYEVQMDRGLLLHARASVADRTLEGREALVALLGVDEGPFLFDPGPPDERCTLGVLLSEVRDELCSVLNARKVQVQDVMNDPYGRLRFRQDLLGLYLRMCPTDVQPVAQALQGGAPPSVLMQQNMFTPVTVEWTVRDLLRKGIAAPT